MWIKLLGICLVCVSCAGIGGGEALRLIGRRRFLEEVKRIAAGLQGEIGYTQAVLPLALCRAGARGDGKAGKPTTFSIPAPPRNGGPSIISSKIERIGLFYKKRRLSKSAGGLPALLPLRCRCSAG